MHQFQQVVGGRRADQRPHAGSVEHAVGVQQLPGKQHALGTQGVAGPVIVDPHPLVADDADALAHTTERIAAAVRSTIRSASSSERQNGGPSITRSPSAPSTCAVEE